MYEYVRGKGWLAFSEDFKRTPIPNRPGLAIYILDRPARIGEAGLYAWGEGRNLLNAIARFQYGSWWKCRYDDPESWTLEIDGTTNFDEIEIIVRAHGDRAMVCLPTLA